MANISCDALLISPLPHHHSLQQVILQRMDRLPPRVQLCLKVRLLVDYTSLLRIAINLTRGPDIRPESYLSTLAAFPHPLFKVASIMGPKVEIDVLRSFYPVKLPRCVVRVHVRGVGKGVFCYSADKEHFGFYSWNPSCSC